jgi:hypothetical protein
MREETSGSIPQFSADGARPREMPRESLDPMPEQRAPAGPDLAAADVGPNQATGPEPVPQPVPETGHETGPGTGPANGDAGAMLFGGVEVERFRGQWRELQADFVDDPMKAVQGADRLVEEVMRTLSETFAAHKHDLEGQWQHGGTGETEDLRVAMRSYRSFLDQLLDA